MNDKLKPCPFCGSEAELYGDDLICWMVECNRCHASSNDYSSKERATVAWNTRADDAPEPTVDNAQADSREQLLEDVNSLCVELWDSDAISGWTTANMLKKDIIKLLDRQAAITNRECENEFLDRAEVIITRREIKQRELQEQVDNLTAELCHERKSREYAYNELNKMLALDGKRVKQINELTAERDELQSIIDHMPKTEAECEACQEAHDRLMFNAKLHQDELRDKLTEKQHVCDVQRDSFLKLERELAEAKGGTA